MWTAFFRRAAFVLILLVAFPLFAVCSHVGESITQQSPGTTGAVIAKAMGLASWGWAHSLCSLLALWLAGRKDWWRSGHGWGRAALYLAAFAYGSIFFYTLQDWLGNSKVQGWALHFEPGAPPFHWPGLERNDYAMPAMLAVPILFQTWLLAAAFKLTRCALVEREQANEATATFGIAAIMAWTALASAVLLSMKFLTWAGVAPDTAYSSMSVPQFVLQFASQVAPLCIITSLIAFLVVWSWSGKWWLPVAVLLVALPLDNYAHELVFRILESFGFEFKGHVLAGDARQRWSYLAGGIWMVWSAFGTARLLGVQLRRGELPQSSPAKDAVTVN
jgi:hypothetical protein